VSRLAVATYGDITVRLESRVDCAGHVRRKFVLERAGEQRHVTHYAFDSYVSVEQPPDAQAASELVRGVHGVLDEAGLKDRADGHQPHHQQVQASPIAVHCGNGRLRSGVLIALMRLVEAARDQQLTLDLAATVLDMRRDRQNMVASEAGLTYLARAFLAALEAELARIRTRRAQRQALAQRPPSVRSAWQEDDAAPSSSTGIGLGSVREERTGSESEEATPHSSFAWATAAGQGLVAPGRAMIYPDNLETLQQAPAAKWRTPEVQFFLQFLGFHADTQQLAEAARLKGKGLLDRPDKALSVLGLSAPEREWLLAALHALPHEQGDLLQAEKRQAVVERHAYLHRLSDSAADPRFGAVYTLPSGAAGGTVIRVTTSAVSKAVHQVAVSVDARSKPSQVRHC